MGSKEFIEAGYKLKPALSVFAREVKADKDYAVLVYVHKDGAWEGISI